MTMLALKRRSELRTDYQSRLGLLKSRKPRIVIRMSLNGTRMQVIKFDEDGDKTLVEVTSQALRKYGWKGHTGNLPAAYLTGFLFGRLALRKGVKEGVVDIGLHRAVKGSSLFAAAKGCSDAGMNVQIGEEILPDEQRIRGTHIAEYAKKLRSEPEKYRRHFSAYIKTSLEPEKLPEHFDDVKNRIIKITGRD